MTLDKLAGTIGSAKVTFPELDLLLEQKYNTIVGLDRYRLLALREPMDATVVQTD